MKSKQKKPLFARQAIYDRQCEVKAFELLFRQENNNESLIDNLNEDMGTAATSNVIIEFFSNVFIEDIVGDKKIFINFNRSHILQGIPKLLSNKRVTVELLETVSADQKVIAAIKSLRSEGYQISLDDFEYSEQTAELIPYADIIKIDVLGKSKRDIEKSLEQIQSFNGTLLAEKIDSQMQYEFCKSLGFHLFQGFFLDKPTIIHGQEIAPSKTILLKLLADLQNPDAEFVDIENIIYSDPQLTYRMLLIANSAAINMGKIVTSISEGLIRLGIDRIRTWVSLLILSKMNDTPIDMLEAAIFRAKMCESLANIKGSIDPQTCFMVGLISTLESILRVKLLDILKKICLSDEINEALLEYKGPIGGVLKMVKNLEKANFSDFHFESISDEEISLIYIENLKFARKMTQDIYS